ncbi:MAG: membrane protein insertion efficiency factor YidD [Candidatus Komeilibacteria bacterium]|nr:membrane protein insertion efficiency factor YidD [Candidatus Komeilibacteria bacterium]
MDTIKKIDKLMTVPVVGAILIYQKVISPDTGALRIFFPNGVCRFRPTCSEYTKQALLRYGLAKGSLLGLRRISRCHPWSVGGYDPILETNYSKK